MIDYRFTFVLIFYNHDLLDGYFEENSILQINTKNFLVKQQKNLNFLEINIWHKIKKSDKIRFTTFNCGIVSKASQWKAFALDTLSPEHHTNAPRQVTIISCRLRLLVGNPFSFVVTFVSVNSSLGTSKKIAFCV